MRNRTLSDILRQVNVAPQMLDRLARVGKALGGGRMPFASSSAIVSNASINLETVVATTPPLNPGADAAVVLVFFQWCSNVIGASATSVQMNIRQGTTISGTALTIGVDVGSVAPGAQFGSCIFAVDTPGAVAGQRYSGTVLVVASTVFSATFSVQIAAIAFG